MTPDLLERIAARVHSTPARAWSFARDLHLGEIFDLLAQTRGTDTACEVDSPLNQPGFSNTNWSFTDLRDFTNQGAATLKSLGVGRGDRVAICTENSIDLPLLAVSAARLGAVAIPLNHQLSAHEILFIVRDSEAQGLIVDPSVSARLLEEADASELIASLDWIAETSGHSGQHGTHATDFLRLDEVWREEQVAQVPAAANDTTTIFYTSGTTGFPKGAKLTSANLLSAMRLIHTLSPVENFRLAAALPAAHIMGFATFVGAMFAGLTYRMHRRFRPDTMLEALGSGEVDFFIGVPSMYQMMESAGAESTDLSGVKVFASAADVMPGRLMQRFKNRGRLLKHAEIPAAFVEIYGSVEVGGASMVRVSLPWLSPAEGGFVGFPIPGYRTRVVDTQGNDLPLGESGELLIRGPGVFSGYLGKDHRDGFESGDWLRTGDLACKSALGLIHFRGREKDVIKAGGFSVYPPEIETLLMQHPDVKVASVVGLPHPYKGEVPVAVICPKVETLDLDTLATWTAERLAAYKRPSKYLHFDAADLPYGPTGKIVKPRLREILLRAQPAASSPAE